MQATNIRRSIIRLTGIVAITTGLVMSSGVAGAMNVEVGLTDCHYDGCSVVTLGELNDAKRGTQVAPKRPVSFPVDRASRRFVP